MNAFFVGLRWLLLPFALLYAVITAIRNWLYNRGILKSHLFPLPVICVGNLTVGGTGKTPHTEYLIRLLKATHSITTLSRGYGRQTKGFLWATPQSTAEQLGDEPLQFYQKFGHEIRVAVGEDRVTAIRKILSAFEFQSPKPEIILLDDAFQHRPVKPSFSILLTDYNRLFYDDFQLPTGNLREPRNGAKRAGVVIVSKCPADLLASERDQIGRNVQKYARPGVPVFFTGIRYTQPVDFASGKDTILSEKVVLVSGIAQAGNLEKYVNQTFECAQHLNFRDHHAYTQADVSAIEEACQKHNACKVLTTEKDYVKLRSLTLPPGIAFYYLPIEIYFLFDAQASFDRLIVQHLTQS